MPKKVIIFFLAALVFRLLLTPSAFHNDILSQTAWGEWIFKNGTLNFYTYGHWIYSWPTQPPLASLLYGADSFIYERLQWLFSNVGVFIATFRIAPTKMLWFFDFSKWFSTALFAETPLRNGALIVTKLPAVFADLGIALIIYSLSKKLGEKKAALFSLIYLISPFSWYLSSIWGQYDQLAVLFLIVSLILLCKRHLYFSPLLMLISVELKPTTAIFIPLFIFIYFKQRPLIKHMVVSSSTCFLVFIVSTKVFTDINILVFLPKILFSKVFLKASEFRVSTNAFNFWHIFIGDKGLSQDTFFLFLPAKIWSFLAYILLNAYVFKNTIKVSLISVIEAMFIIGAGSWLFMTNMLDRYYFAGVISLLFLSVFKKKIFKYWLIASIIYWLNLFNHWWYPNLNFLKEILIWQDGLFTRLFALINVLVFLKVLSLLRHEKEW